MGRLPEVLGPAILMVIISTTSWSSPVIDRSPVPRLEPVDYITTYIRAFHEQICDGLARRDECLVAVAERKVWKEAPDLGRLIVEAADNAGVPWSVILVLVQFESGFRVGVEGRIGERGLLQVHGQAAKGHDLSTAAGELAAGAMWYATMLEKCGDQYQALQAYQTGRCRGKAAGPARRLARITQIDDEFSALSSQASSR